MYTPKSCVQGALVRRSSSTFFSFFGNSFGTRCFIDEGKQTVNLASLSKTHRTSAGTGAAPPASRLRSCAASTPCYRPPIVLLRTSIGRADARPRDPRLALQGAFRGNSCPRRPRSPGGRRNHPVGRRAACRDGRAFDPKGEHQNATGPGGFVASTARDEAFCGVAYLVTQCAPGGRATRADEVALIVTLFPRRRLGRTSSRVAEQGARGGVQKFGFAYAVRLRRVGLAGSPSANDLLGVRHPVSPAERLSGFRDWLNPVAWPLARVGDPSHCPATSRKPPRARCWSGLMAHASAIPALAGGLRWSAGRMGSSRSTAAGWPTRRTTSWR